MPERVNIGRMAEIISADIFSKLGWEIHGVPNESWKCVEPAHEKKDHPTDVTFVYEDPYSPTNIHLLTDLKSYAAGSITDSSLAEMIESLALAVDCAKINDNWKDLYLKRGLNYDIQGLLFIYNHDSEYDKVFSKQLNAAFQRSLRIPKGVRLSIIGPDEVWYLNEMLTDLATLAHDGLIPASRKDVSFFYHSYAMGRLAKSPRSRVATIDVLKGKHQLLTYSMQQKHGQERGMIVYYRGPGKEVREFIVRTYAKEAP